MSEAMEDLMSCDLSVQATSPELSEDVMVDVLTEMGALRSKAKLSVSGSRDIIEAIARLIAGEEGEEEGEEDGEAKRESPEPPQPKDRNRRRSVMAEVFCTQEVAGCGSCGDLFTFRRGEARVRCQSCDVVNRLSTSSTSRTNSLSDITGPLVASNGMAMDCIAENLEDEAMLPPPPPPPNAPSPTHRHSQSNTTPVPTPIAHVGRSLSASLSQRASLGCFETDARIVAMMQRSAPTRCEDNSGHILDEFMFLEDELWRSGPAHAQAGRHLSTIRRGLLADMGHMSGQFLALTPRQPPDTQSTSTQNPS